MKIRPVRAELFHSDRYDKADRRFPQFCERAYNKYMDWKTKVVKAHPSVQQILKTQSKSALSCGLHLSTLVLCGWKVQCLIMRACG